MFGRCRPVSRILARTRGSPSIGAIFSASSDAFFPFFLDIRHGSAKVPPMGCPFSRLGRIKNGEARPSPRPPGTREYGRNSRMFVPVDYDSNQRCMRCLHGRLNPLLPLGEDPASSESRFSLNRRREGRPKQTEKEKGPSSGPILCYGCSRLPTTPEAVQTATTPMAR